MTVTSIGILQFFTATRTARDLIDIWNVLQRLQLRNIISVLHNSVPYRQDARRLTQSNGHVLHCVKLFTHVHVYN